MATTPAAPKPTNIPDGAPSQAAQRDEANSDIARGSLPEPLIRLELRDLRHPSTKVFLDNTNAAVDVAELVRTVLDLLYLTGKRASPGFQPHIPDTRSITFVLRNMDGVAYTTGIELDSAHKEIHLSLSYIEHVSKSSKEAAAIRNELMGVMCHELVHCWQHDANGTAPGGLIEGVADWVRLRAGFVPPHWKQEADGDWDAGYQTTGYFLEWIESYSGAGSVSRLNDALRDKDYDEKTLWKALFGESVDALWARYRKSLKKHD